MQNLHKQIAHNSNKQANLKLSTQNPPKQKTSNNKKMGPLVKGFAQNVP